MTNGLLSVVKDGKVILKVVVGCDGYNVNMLKTLLKIEHEFPQNQKCLDAINTMAENVNFGCNNCRVVMNKTDVLYNGDGELSPLYRKTFNKDTFNPRWKSGICGYTKVIEL